MYPQTKIAIPIFQAKKEDVIKVSEYFQLKNYLFCLSIDQ